MNGHRHSACALALLLGSSSGAVWGLQAHHGNDLPLHHAQGGLAIALSNPSVGAATGTFPPNLGGDLFWKVLPGDRVLAHDGPDGATMHLDGFGFVIADTDYATDTLLYDALIGPAVPSVTHPGNLEPAFLQSGLTSEVFVSFGPLGLPDPCTLGAACDPNGCFAEGGGVPSWYLKLELSEPIAVPADGTPASDLAITWLYPGGMSIDLDDPCAAGSDFTLQNIQVTAESQGDDLGGISAFGGRQVAGGGPFADPVTETSQLTPTFSERVLNVIADSGKGDGLELGWTEGGATNALKLSAGSGEARLGYGIRAFQDRDRPNQAFVATSLTPVGPPGVPVAGAALLVGPSPLFATTLASSAASLKSVLPTQGGGIGDDGIARFYAADERSPALILDVPASAPGLDLYSQGVVWRLEEQTLHATNRVRTSLLP